jgi:hypothetical protein
MHLWTGNVPIRRVHSDVGNGSIRREPRDADRLAAGERWGSAACSAVQRSSIAIRQNPRFVCSSIMLPRLIGNPCRSHQVRYAHATDETYQTASRRRRPTRRRHARARRSLAGTSLLYHVPQLQSRQKTFAIGTRSVAILRRHERRPRTNPKRPRGESRRTLADGRVGVSDRAILPCRSDQDVPCQLGLPTVRWEADLTGKSCHPHRCPGLRQDSR